MARWVALNLIDPLIAYHTVNVMRTLAERMRSVAAPGAVQQRDSLEEFAHLWKSNREDTLIGGITATGKPYANHAWVYACRRHSSRQPAKALNCAASRRSSSARAAWSSLVSPGALELQ